MAFDEFAMDDCGVARRQTRWHAVLLFEAGHVAFDMVFNFEAVGFEMTDPLFAAAAIGVAMDFDRDQVGGLGQGGDEQGAQGDQTQRGSHDGISTRLAVKKERILTGFSYPASTECFQLLQDRLAG
jgi:hypothetical protein